VRDNGGTALVVVGIVAVCALLVSCIRDYSTATPQVAEVLVTDKQFYPAHYDQHCSTDSKGYMSCYQSYVPPSWAVNYADEQNHSVTVSQGTYDALRIGERKVLRYDLGGGYWHARYNEQFQFGQIRAEGMPPR